MSRIAANLGKLAALVVMRKTISPGMPLFQRLLGGIAAVMVLALIASVLTGVLVIGGLYAIYLTLIAYGLDTQAAAISLAVVTLVLIAGCFGGAVLCARNLRTVMRRMMIMESPVAYRAGTVANAFVDGLMDR